MLPRTTVRAAIPAVLALLAGTATGSDIATVIAIGDHDPSDTLDSIVFDGVTLGVTNAGLLGQAPTADLWGIVLTTNGTPTSADQVLVLGSATGFAPAAREGVTTFAPDAAITFLAEAPSINDAGRWALAFTPQNLGAASGSDLDERVIVATPDGAGGFTLETVALLFDDVPAGNLGDFDNALIDNDGEVAFFDTSFASNFSGRETDAYLLNVGPTATPTLLAGDLAAAEAETVPAGQNPASATRPLESVTDFAIDIDGSSWILEGTLEDDSSVDLDGDGTLDFIFDAAVFGSSTGDVMVVDGTVVSQEGVVFQPAVTGFTSPVSGDDNPVMNAAGAYAFELTNADGTNHAILNPAGGTGFRVIASSGQPIVPGADERWASIAKIRLDGSGNFMVIGTTDARAPFNTVAVRNAAAVVAREGEAIDVDGNGSIDGFVNLVNDRALLANDGVNAYFAFRLRSVSARTDNEFRIGGNNASLFRVPVARTAIVTCPADVDPTGGVGVVDIFDILGFFVLFGDANTAADLDGDAQFTIFDILAFFDAFGAGCSL